MKAVNRSHIIILQGFSSQVLPKWLGLDAKTSSRSFAWQSIVKAKNLIQSGLLWRVGDGNQIKDFEDRWLPGEEPTKVISPSNSTSAEWTVSRLLDPNGAS